MSNTNNNKSFNDVFTDSYEKNFSILNDFLLHIFCRGRAFFSSPNETEQKILDNIANIINTKKNNKDVDYLKNEIIKHFKLKENGKITGEHLKEKIKFDLKAEKYSSNFFQSLDSCTFAIEQRNFYTIIDLFYNSPFYESLMTILLEEFFKNYKTNDFIKNRKILYNISLKLEFDLINNMSPDIQQEYVKSLCELLKKTSNNKEVQNKIKENKTKTDYAFAVSDIHGNIFSLIMSMIESGFVKINEKEPYKEVQSPKTKKTIIIPNLIVNPDFVINQNQFAIAGDLIDRGPESIMCLALVRDLYQQSDEIIKNNKDKINKTRKKNNFMGDDEPENSMIYTMGDHDVQRAVSNASKNSTICEYIKQMWKEGSLKSSYILKNGILIQHAPLRLNFAQNCLKDLCYIPEYIKKSEKSENPEKKVSTPTELFIEANFIENNKEEKYKKNEKEISNLNEVKELENKLKTNKKYKTLYDILSENNFNYNKIKEKYENDKDAFDTLSKQAILFTNDVIGEKYIFNDELCLIQDDKSISYISDESNGFFANLTYDGGSEAIGYSPIWDRHRPVDYDYSKDYFINGQLTGHNTTSDYEKHLNRGIFNTKINKTYVFLLDLKRNVVSNDEDEIKIPTIEANNVATLSLNMSDNYKKDMDDVSVTIFEYDNKYSLNKMYERKNGKVEIQNKNEINNKTSNEYTTMKEIKETIDNSNSNNKNTNNNKTKIKTSISINKLYEQEFKPKNEIEENKKYPKSESDKKEEHTKENIKSNDSNLNNDNNDNNNNNNDNNDNNKFKTNLTKIDEEKNNNQKLDSNVITNVTENNKNKNNNIDNKNNNNDNNKNNDNISNIEDKKSFRTDTHADNKSNDNYKRFNEYKQNLKSKRKKNTFLTMEDKIKMKKDREELIRKQNEKEGTTTCCGGLFS